MMFIDMTGEFVPVFYAMNALLVVAALAVAAEPMAHVLRRWTRTLQRPRISFHRPALGHSR
jgi:hypothetical protein